MNNRTAAFEAAHGGNTDEDRGRNTTNAQVLTRRDEDRQCADFSGFPAQSNEMADVGRKSSLCMFERTRLEINDELQRARSKFPMPNPTFVALVEEVGELAQALLKCDPTKDNYPLRCKHVYQEAVQVATMAIRVLEEGDRDYPAYVAHLGMSDSWSPDRKEVMPDDPERDLRHVAPPQPQSAEAGATAERWIGLDPPMPNADYEVKIMATADPVPPMPEEHQDTKWLRSLARRGGKGAVGNIDARSLGRIADTIASLRARVEELEAENYELKGWVQPALDADKTIATITSQVDELREALEPFAKSAEIYADTSPAVLIDEDGTLSISDLRRALAALANTEPTK